VFTIYIQLLGDVLDQDAKLDLATVSNWSMFSWEERLGTAFFLDLVGDGYNGSSLTAVPDNDPLDNCSDESHGISQLFLLSAALFLLTYFTQVHMFLE
jgi:hypothetical protein